MLHPSAGRYGLEAQLASRSPAPIQEGESSPPYRQWPLGGDLPLPQVNDGLAVKSRLTRRWRLPGGLKFNTIGVGGVTCGVTADGTAYCWGWNSVGAVGIPIVAH